MVMRQMRQNTKIIMLATALAFVALMVFQWGMDITGRSGRVGDLGRVGGTPVTVEAFQNAYRGIYDEVQRNQQIPISTQQNLEIEEMAWDNVVNQVLINNELSRRGIRVTDDEIRQAVMYSPPPWLQSSFLNEFGQVDLQAYQAYLGQVGQDPAFLQELEQYYRELIPREKLIRQVTAGIYVSDAELWEIWKAGNERVEVTFLAIDPDERVSDVEAGVTPAEIERYYEEHPGEFMVPARASVRYAIIDKAPTAADTLAALEVARDIRQQILDGEEFGAVAMRESGDPESAPIGGFLGEIRPGDLPPELDEAVFGIPVGEVSEPILSPIGYHLLEVSLREGDVAEASHILVPIELDGESELAVLAMADSLESLGEGLTLDASARELGLPVLEGVITDQSALLSRVGNASEGQDWIFQDEEGAGAVSPVFEAEDAFYMLEIVGLSPAGTLLLEEVSGAIGAQLRAERKLDRVLGEARGWGAELRGDRGTTLEALAERIGVEVSTVGPFTRRESVPGLGVMTPAIGAAFGAPVGRAAGPVVADGRVVLLRVDEKVEADREAWDLQKESQRAQVTSQIRQERLILWLEGLRETTRIVDDRDEYFRAAEQQQQDQVQLPIGF